MSAVLKLQYPEDELQNVYFYFTPVFSYAAVLCRSHKREQAVKNITSSQRLEFLRRNRVGLCTECFKAKPYLTLLLGDTFNEAEQNLARATFVLRLFDIKQEPLIRLSTTLTHGGARMVFYTSHRLLQLISGSYDGMVCNNAALLWITHSPRNRHKRSPFYQKHIDCPSDSSHLSERPCCFQGKTHTLDLTVLKAAVQQQTLQMQAELCGTFNTLSS